MVSPEPMQNPGPMKEVMDQGVDDNEARADVEPPRPGRPGPHQQVRQRHRHDLVRNPVDMPKRLNQRGPGRREIGGSGMVG